MIDSATSDIRCAIYTRKSTSEGLEQEFNTLDAQREAAEAYIASQKSAGWSIQPTRYDDGGFTGGNLDRPALKRLMDDIEAGKIDVVVVYKVDRLSRSLLDFSRIIESFDKHGVSFVSVTQQFNTTSSMGRLTLNILLSFAQFEREIISERTRDKMAAARRKGKYIGGAPILGYDIDREASRLIVNDVEAIRVNQIFEFYLKHESLLATVADLNNRGWVTKQWTTKKGVPKGGVSFNKTNLHSLLTNIAYIGKIKYKDEIHEGQHDGILDPDLFDRAQRLLRLNHRTGGKHVRNKYGAILRGLLNCSPCDCSMAHSHTKRRNKVYRYYVCTHAQKTGWANCPSKSVPAAEIEQFVVDQIREIVADPKMVAVTLKEARKQIESRLEALEVERLAIERDVSRANRALHNLLAEQETRHTVARLADLQERTQTGERRLTGIQSEMEEFRSKLVTEKEVAKALREFDPIWEQLSKKEQAKVLKLLIERVDYDGKEGTVSVTFRPMGFRELAEELELEELTV